MKKLMGILVLVTTLFVTHAPEAPALPILDECTGAILAYNIALYEYNQCSPGTFDPCADLWVTVITAESNMNDLCHIADGG
jgi:hypothetical protein